MRILGIDHINIAGSAALIERCRAFYVDVLGLTDGFRPPFTSRGFWLYAGDRPLVHLTERENRDLDGGSTPFDHFALDCEGLSDALERLTKHGIAYTVDRVPDANRAQLFVNDPAGVSLELNFPTV